jgi:hypothetical protein
MWMRRRRHRLRPFPVEMRDYSSSLLKEKPMRLITCSQIILGGACALLLAGCAEGTSTAGFSSDEDAYSPHSGPAPGSATSVASGNALFGQRPPGQLYGTSPFPAQGGDQDASQGFDNLEIVSPGLKTKLAVMRVGSDRTEGNLLSVFAGLKNKSSHPLPLEVQTVYKDKSDQPLTDGRSSWVPITLKPYEETQYRSVAISEDASDFMVRIRHASDTTAP